MTHGVELYVTRLSSPTPTLIFVYSVRGVEILERRTVPLSDRTVFGEISVETDT